MQYAPFINLNPVHFIIINNPGTDLWFTILALFWCTISAFKFKLFNQKKSNSSNFRCANSDNPFLILGITDSSNDMSCPGIINIDDGNEDKEEEKTF